MQTTPTVENYFRRLIILFGRNVASYKFALAKAMIELAGGKTAAGSRFAPRTSPNPFARNISTST